MPNPERTGFRGWPIVGIAFFAQLLAFGCTISVYGLFIPVLTGEFGASFMTANLGLSILMVVMALAGVVVGPLLDRYSIRVLMAVGALLNAVSFAAMSRATELWQLAVLFGGCLAVGVALFGPLAANTVVAKWFEEYRGRAVGIASMGPPTGGMVLAVLSGVLIEDFGWRTTLLIFGALHLLIIPAIWWVIRSNPQELGQLPDGKPRDDSKPVAVGEGRNWATGEVFRSVNFWSLAAALGIVGAVAGAFNANVIPYGGDLGIGLREASLFVSVIGATAIVGTVAFGALADRVDNRLLLWIAVGLQAVPFVVLRVVEPSYAVLFGAVLVFGVAAGGLAPLVASAVGQGFGALSFGRVMGFIGPVTLPFGFVGPPLVGYLRQTTGSYLAAFDLFLVGFVIAAIVLIGLRLPRSTD